MNTSDQLLDDNFTMITNSGYRLKQKSIFYAAVIILVPILYFFTIGRRGWSDTDDGFILGVSWRIVNGEMPYRDFTYVRPPLSPYFHSIWFHIIPSNYVFAFSRFISIAQVWIYSLVSAWVLCGRDRNHNILKNNWILISICGFIVSISYFTPMPWHTIDGIFFATLGAWLLSYRRSSLLLVASGALIFISCASKQSFYPLIIITPAYLLLNNRMKDFFIIVSTIAILLITSITIGIHYNIFKMFIQQTTGSSSMKVAFKTGIWRYLYASIYPAILLIFSWLTGWYYTLRKKQSINPNITILIFIVVFSIKIILRMVRTHAPIDHQLLGLSQLFLILGITSIFQHNSDQFNINTKSNLILFLSIAWCASISYGFQSPLLFTTPLIIGAILFARDPSKPLAMDAVLFHCAIPAFASMIALASIAFPYRNEQFYTSQTAHLGAINKKLTMIYSTAPHAEKLAEFTKFAKQTENSFVTLPAFTLSHYLQGTVNPLQVDWPMLLEMGKTQPEINNRINKSVRFVILDIAETKEFTLPKSHFNVPLASYILTHWTAREKGNYYYIMENPNLGDQRPTESALGSPGHPLKP